jgi:Amt family ammonium transporter
MFGGIWGTIAVGLFDNEKGLFYGGDGSGAFFGYQLLAILCVVAWVGGTSSAIFYALKRLGLFRVDKAIEIIGLDIAEMGGLSEDIYEKVRRDFGGGASPRALSFDGKINLSNKVDSTANEMPKRE